MMIIKTKNSRTNRVNSPRRPKPVGNICDTVTGGYDTVVMVFKREWAEFIQKTMPYDEGSRFAFKIMQYGAEEIEPTDLTPEERSYFEAVVRPELDRQIKRKKEGKPL